MREKSFENKVKEFLKTQNCYYVKQFGCAFTKSGIPDLLVCCNGYFIGVELKAEKGRLAPLQIYNLEQIKKAGGISLALYPKDFDDFKKLIKDLQK